MERRVCHPGWVLKHKRKGTEIRQLRGYYYLYKIKSVYDPQRKRAKKVTERFLGKITEDGLIKPKYERVMENLSSLTVKEFGASSMIIKLSGDIIELLKKSFPSFWKEMLVFSVERFFHASPMKNVYHYYADSYLSETYPNVAVLPKQVSNMLKIIGNQRGKNVEFMKNFIEGDEFSIIDLTHTFSFSENIISATLGHNSEKEYAPQINLSLIFSLDKHHPSFFRIVPGSIRDISTFLLTVKESGIKKAIIIGDKGFYSEENINYLDKKETELDYIFPLKRNSSLIDYSPIISGNKKNFDGYFLFEKRIIWHYEKMIGNKRILLFLDEKLKMEEEKDMMIHIEDKKIPLNDFYERQFRIGTIAVITKTVLSARKVYELLKSRIEIEIAFDTFKNILHADRTYMREDTQLEGWMLINFISMLLYYRLYNELSKHDILKKFSPKDVILHFSRVKKIKIGEKWQTSEVPKTTRLLAEKLKIYEHIT